MSEAPIDTDQLAQYIRRLDGDSRMSAESLAQHILEWLKERMAIAEPMVSGSQLESIEAEVAGLDPDSESCVSNGDVFALVKAVRTFQVRQLMIGVAISRR